MAGTLEDGCTKARRGGRRAFEAEREGFEPSIEVDPLCRFSKPVPSASRPSLQRRLMVRPALNVTARARPEQPAFEEARRSVTTDRGRQSKRDMLTFLCAVFVLSVAAGR